MNDSEAIYSCIGTIIRFVFIVTLGILCPLLFISEIVSAPQDVQLFTCIWVGIILFMILFCKKWGLRYAIIIIATLIYGYIFIVEYVNHGKSEIYNDDDGVFMAICSIICTAFTAGYISFKILDFINLIRKERINSRIKSIDSKISNLNGEISELAKNISSKRNIIKLLKLIEFCGADNSAIENNPNVSNIKKIYDEIALRKNKIEKLSLKRKVYTSKIAK